jgi:ribose-phosphate pyrophosphokinase
MSGGALKLFSGSGNRPLARRICENLDLALGNGTSDRFPDGEMNVRLDEDVRGADIFLVQPTCPPVNENLMELLMMIDAARRASASRITAVMPYYGYARKDRKDEGRVPITAKLVANLLVTAGVDRVLTLDLHAAQIQGFFDIPVDHLFAFPVIAQYFAESGFGNSATVFAAPDVGRIKMARSYANYLSGRLAIVDKRRMGPDQAEVGFVIGEVEGMDVILVDDMISTGGSVLGATRALLKSGAKSVRACAVHGILCPPAAERLASAGLAEIILTDTVPLEGRVEQLAGRVRILSVAGLLAEAIRRIHMNESVSALFAKWSREP